MGFFSLISLSGSLLVYKNATCMYPAVLLNSLINSDSFFWWNLQGCCILVSPRPKILLIYLRERERART